MITHIGEYYLIKQSEITNYKHQLIAEKCESNKTCGLTLLLVTGTWPNHSLWKLWMSMIGLLPTPSPAKDTSKALPSFIDRVTVTSRWFMSSHIYIIWKCK